MYDLHVYCKYRQTNMLLFWREKKVPQDKGQIYLQSGQEGLGKVGGSGG